MGPSPSRLQNVDRFTLAVSQPRYPRLEDHLPVLLDIALNDLTKLLGTVGDDDEAELRESLAHFRRMQRAHDSLVHRPHEAWRRLRGREETVPELEIVAGDALLGDRRQV